MKLYVHHELEANPELRDEIDAFGWRIEQALRDGGPWIKALRGPWGRTLRARVGRRRALFSWQHEGKDTSAWLHEIGWRREIYDRRTGLQRAHAWVEAERANALPQLNYTLRQVSRASPTALESEPTSIVPALSEEQAAFVRSVIPLEDDGRSRNAFVFLAKGPPGSGKTVVAADIARDAFLDSPNAQLGEDGADVLVLVPSGKLLRQYRDEMRGTTLHEGGAFARAVPEPRARIWIERFSEFFSAFSSTGTSRTDLQAWWNACLHHPSLRRWSVAHPRVADPRFLDLLDACFGGQEEPGGGAKDALFKFDQPFYQALAALTRGEREFIVGEKWKRGITLRWETAVAALQGLKSANTGRPLVVVVDEAQDLVPAEWQTLVEACFHRHRSGTGQTVIALLGDENQRVAPTAFAWSDVDSFVRGLHEDLASGDGCVSTKLTGSFRIRREIARVANTLMEGALVEDRARRASVADPDELHAGGSVVVVRSPDPNAAIRDSMTVLQKSMANEDRLVHIGAGLTGLAGVDSMDPREAKGLEYPTLVATALLQDDLDWDTRSRAYVTITRAKDRIALVLTDAEWERVAVHWEHLVELEPADGLNEILTSLVLRPGDQDRADEQRSRIDNLVDEADSKDRDFPLEVFERAGRLVEEGTAARIVAHLDDVLRRRPAWSESLRRFAADPSAPTVQRIGAWLLLGDIGAAVLVARTARASRTVTSYLERLSREDGPLAAASIELRTAPGVAPKAHLVDLMVDAFWSQAERAFIERDFVAEGAYEPGRRDRRSDFLAKAVIGAVKAAQESAVASVDATAQRLLERRNAISERFTAAVGQRKAQALLEKQLDALTVLATRAESEGL